MALNERLEMTLVKRRIAKTVTLPAAEPGFMGDGHTAVEVLTPTQLVQNDPFILLMDDRLDLTPEVRQLGGAHPHAGLETVTLFLEGSAVDPDEGDTVPGDAQWMTAGRGVIHGENLLAGGRMRVLQLWVRLPKASRGVPARVQLIKRADVPTRHEPGATARVYSGASGDAQSQTLNYAPVTMVDFQLEPGATVEQQLPASDNGFLYVIAGSTRLGPERTWVAEGQVAWLDRPPTSGDSVLRLEGGERGGRVVLYAGQPQNDPLIHHGPFVAGSQNDLIQVFNDYRAGQFTRLSTLLKNRHVA